MNTQCSTTSGRCSWNSANEGGQVSSISAQRGSRPGTAGVCQDLQEDPKTKSDSGSPDRPAMNDPIIENEVIRRWQIKNPAPARRIALELRISRYLVKVPPLHHASSGGDRARDGASLSALRCRSRGENPGGSTSLSFKSKTGALAFHDGAAELTRNWCGRDFTGKNTIVKDLVRRLRPQRRRQPVLCDSRHPRKARRMQMDYANYEIHST